MKQIIYDLQKIKLINIQIQIHAGILFQIKTLTSDTIQQVKQKIQKHSSGGKKKI
jgi:hypothetical protein